jgi:hypothetical protein
MIERARPMARIANAPLNCGPLSCPLCGGVLQLDSWWLSPHWLCTQGHSYSNVLVLDAELQRGNRQPEHPSNYHPKAVE